MMSPVSAHLLLPQKLMLMKRVSRKFGRPRRSKYHEHVWLDPETLRLTRAYSPIVGKQVTGSAEAGD